MMFAVQPKKNYTRFFTAALVVLLLFAFVLQDGAALFSDSQTIDEAAHIAAGFSYLTLRDFIINPEHPPLTKLAQAGVVAIFSQATFPRDSRYLTPPNQWGLGSDFLYHNTVPFRLILYLARLPALFFGLILGLVIFLVGRWWSSAASGIFALSLYAFSPTVLAHAHLATNDVAAALWYLLCCATIAAYLQRPSAGRLLLLALTLGSAQLVKFNLLLAIILYIVVGFWSCTRWGKRMFPQMVPLFYTRGLLWILICTAVFVVIGYGVQPHRIFDYATDPENTFFHSIALVQNPYVKEKLVWFAQHAAMPGYWFFEGVARLFAHENNGHDAFLLGQVSRYGWWYYFPIAFAAKTSTATLAVLIWYCASKVRQQLRLMRGRLTAPLSLPHPFGVILWFGVALYVAVSMRSHINIGARHLLPIYPLLFLVLGDFLAEQWRKKKNLSRALILLALLGHIISAGWIFPRYISSFNLFAGGNTVGPTILGDSNADWGQGLFGLAKYIRNHGINDYALAYYGNADLESYGLAPRSFPPGSQNDSLPSVLFVSTSRRYFSPELFDWIETRYTKTDVVSDVYLVYRIRP